MKRSPISEARRQYSLAVTLYHRHEKNFLKEQQEYRRKIERLRIQLRELEDPQEEAAK